MRFEFTPEQIEQARVWRFEHDASWKRIAARLSCHPGTIRSHLDPTFAQRYSKQQHVRAQRRYRRVVTARVEEQQYENMENAAISAKTCDDAFQARLTLAIRTGAEHAPTEVCRAASTQSPRRLPLARPSLASASSPAQMCADFA